VTSTSPPDAIVDVSFFAMARSIGVARLARRGTFCECPVQVATTDRGDAPMH
jgi:hypothetical protein